MNFPISVKFTFLVLAVFLYLGACKKPEEQIPQNKDANTPIQKEESRDQLVADAQGGKVEAMIKIRHRMVDGENLPISQQEMEDLIQRSAESGNPDAQCEMGIILLRDDCGRPKDVQQSIKWLSLGADQEHPQSMQILGIHLFHGFTEIAKDREKAIDLLRKAAKKGNLGAQIDIGQIYAFDPEYEDRKKEGFNILLPLAEAGNENAFRPVAIMLQNGIGVEKNTDSAIEWFTKSAKKGDASSQYELGDIYLNEKNIKLAMDWYTKSAENGDIKAQNKLGEIYSAGYFTGIPDAQREDYKSLENAIYYLKKSADQNDVVAQCQLAEIYLTKDNYNYNPTKAIKYLEKAYEQKSGRAAETLADCYENGEGVQLDENKSFELQLEASIEFGNSDIYNIEGSSSRRKDNNRFIQKLQEASKRGNNSAKYSLANIYRFDFMTGDALSESLVYKMERNLLKTLEDRFITDFPLQPTKKNIPEAIRLLKSAAESGHQLSQTELGIMYTRGGEVEPNIDKAIEYLTLAAEGGNGYAAFNLGKLYANRASIQNSQKAIYYLQKSYDQGISNSANELGLIYLNGKGISQNGEQALKWFKQAANDHGDTAANACFYIYKMYEYGEGVLASSSLANEWLEKSADLNNLNSIEILAKKNYNGQGIPKNPSKAFDLYTKLAEQGKKDAQFQLAIMCAQGIGTNKNLNEHAKWLMEAAKQNHPGATFYLGNAYIYGNGVEKNPELAAEFYEKAASLGEAKAYLKLGIRYYYGNGLKQNYDKAFKWLLKSAETGDSNAQNHVGLSYQNGYGTKKNLNLAAEWFEKASNAGDTFAPKNLSSLLIAPPSNKDGFKADLKRAANLIEKLDDKDASDYCSLGWIYEQPAFKNTEKMIDSYQMAVSMGNSIAMRNMAYCYVRGDGVVKNYAEALVYHYLAQANANADQKAISFLENYLSPNSIQAAQKKAEQLHAQIKQNKNKPKSETSPKTADNNTPTQPNGSGSGFLISKEGLVATAFHVVDGAAKITIKTSKGTHEAKILSSDKSNDIAILKILGIKEPLVAASIASSSDVQLGQSVFTLGFPNIDVQGFNLKMTKGDISSVSGIQDDPRQFQISVPVQAGNSGGPLFDESGNIVGIVVSKLNAAFMAKHSGDLPQNVNYAVKSAYLMPLLDQFMNQLPAPNKRTDDVKTEELVNKVKDACVMILVE